MAKDTILSAAASAALRTWSGEVRQLCSLAGQPARAAEFIRLGAPIGHVRAALTEAQAVQLRADESVSVLQLGRPFADDAEDGTGAQLSDATPELHQAQRYAATCGDLCRLAGLADMAEAFIEAQMPLRLVRHELIEARAAAAGEHVSNLHNPGAPAGPLLPDAHRIYRRRALAMGQQPA